MKINSCFTNAAVNKRFQPVRKNRGNDVSTVPSVGGVKNEMLLHLTGVFKHKVINCTIGKSLIFKFANPDFARSDSYTIKK